MVFILHYHSKEGKYNKIEVSTVKALVKDLEPFLCLYEEG
jgi:hypothetical protein